MPRRLKSPLRYPGGKSRALDRILPLIPLNIREYREPFVGGGSVFLAMRARFGTGIRYVIGDLNHDLVCFWRFVRDDLSALVSVIESFRAHYADDGSALYAFLRDDANMRSDFDRAVRFFIMNRITFSGVMDAGGYSQQAFSGRFTASSIDRLLALEGALSGVEIIHGDYEPLITRPGEGVFLFLDPPYHSATASKLYGVRGVLHTGFDHARFAAVMRATRHNWLITYDDSALVRANFDFAQITPWQLQYGMNNYKQTTAAAGDELFITPHPPTT